ncbi:hypothetical protein [Stutzerimonas xanthomarina]|uniref:hypothetical protein n=1 Tax=Stutzerimonas xanthomarina TaxID=271420 RepID=UPI003AA9A87F
MFEEELPIWLSNIGTISSVVGFLVTAFLLWEARKLRNSFLQKARLPEAIEELTKINKDFANNLKNWGEESREGIRQLRLSKEIVESLKPKLFDLEKKKCANYIQMLSTRRFIIFSYPLTADYERAWELYHELSSLIKSLEQLHKDIKWNS